MNLKVFMSIRWFLQCKVLLNAKNTDSAFGSTVFVVLYRFYIPTHPPDVSTFLLITR